MTAVLVARRPLRAEDLADAGRAEPLGVGRPARAVEFVDRPRERPCGIDSSFRDPPGDHLRSTLVMLP